MASPYSLDLRSKAVSLYKKKQLKQTDVCELYQISISSFKRWLKLERETGSLDPKQIGGYKPRKIDANGCKTINKLINKDPTITIKELCEMYNKKHNSDVGSSVMTRTLKRLKLSYKRLSITSQQKETEEVKKNGKIS